MRFSFLATGTELCTGEIVNTNTAMMARKLSDLGYVIGHHMVCADDRTVLRSALDFLGQEHRCVILSGGLGPTSDDHTRFVLADYCGRPLLRDAQAFEALSKHFAAYGRTMTESQASQALFPEGAIVLPHPVGTAAGFWLDHAGHSYLALPGPPKECLSLFDAALPMIRSRFEPQKVTRYFQLLGGREGEIADRLEAFLGTEHLFEIGYRIHHPYVSVKLSYTPRDQSAFEACAPALKAMLAQYCWAIEETSTTYSHRLLLEAPKLPQLSILDQATGGLLQHTLHTPSTREHFVFVSQSEPALIHLTGLDEYWTASARTFHAQLQIGDLHYALEGPIFKSYPPTYGVVEWVCQKILETYKIS